ncbi:MAG: transcription antitermination factor NusB [Candidatus Pacebacteria bacterium]|nr:transcription antitermination factor NusB [Candidatus Paceibacterota bacterium]
MSATNPVPENSGKRFQRCRRFARACAFQALYELDVRHAWGDPEEQRQYFWQRVESSDDVPEGCDLERARAFAETIVDAVLMNKDNIDQRIQAVAEHWSLDRMSMIDRNILRLAGGELLYVAKIPPVTAVNEAIELAKEYGDKDSPRFINGILDKILREREKTTV